MGLSCAISARWLCAGAYRTRAIMGKTLIYRYNAVFIKKILTCGTAKKWQPNVTWGVNGGS